MRKIILSLMLLLLSSASLVGVTAAAFEENVKVAGVSFTVGEAPDDGGTGDSTEDNTDLKILVNNADGTTESNLADSVGGPSFDSIHPYWEETIGMKLNNQGDEELNIIASAEYIEDADSLRDDIYVEIFAWDDANSDGVVDESELGESYGYDTILRLRNDTFDMGNLSAGSTRGFALKFDGTGLTEFNIGESAVYDFVFTGVETGGTQ